MSLVQKYDLAGAASWRKGFETEDIWPIYYDSLKPIPTIQETVVAEEEIKAEPNDKDKKKEKRKKDKKNKKNKKDKKDKKKDKHKKKRSDDSLTNEK